MGLTRIRADQISNIDYKQAVRVITVANVTLSGGAPDTVDGVSLSAGDRILVTGQSTGSQNGIYVVATLGTGSDGTWDRSTDGNENGEIEAGMIIMVTEGDAYKDTQWKLTTNNPIVIGTTALVFEQNSAFAFGNVYANSTAVLASSVGDALTLTPGDNISITGNNTSKTVTIGVTGISLNSISNGTSNVNVISSGGNVTVGIGGTSNVAVFSIGGANVTGYVTATGNITGGNLSTAGRLGVGTASPDYQVDITNTGQNALLVLRRTDGVGTFIEGQATRGAFGTIGADPLVLAYNSLAVISIGAGGAITVNPDGGSPFTFPTADGSANNILATDGAGNVDWTGTPTFTSMSATGNITGGNLITAGLISATGNITGANLQVNNNAVITGNLTVNGNLTYINSNVVTINDKFINVANNAATASEANGGGLGVGPVGSEYATLTYDNSANTWDTNIGISVAGIASATGNITGGNLLTGGLISATGNIAGGNLSGTSIAGTLITAAQTNITSVGTLSSLSVSGNVQGGNLRTAGLISATGTVTGSTFVGDVTAAVISASGNVTGGNVLTGGLISATGNITGGNILGNGAGLDGINAFGNIAVSGQTNVTADTTNDVLTLVGGEGIDITTDAGNSIVTIAAANQDVIWITGGDMDLVTDAVTISYDFDLVTGEVTTSYDLGGLVTSGIIYPDQLVLPSKTVAELANISAAPAGQFVFCSNESGGSIPAFSDGTNWRRVTDRAIVT